MHFSSLFFSFPDYVEIIVFKPRAGAWGGRFNQSADFPRGQGKVGRVAGGLTLGAVVYLKGMCFEVGMARPGAALMVGARFLRSLAGVGSCWAFS